MSSTPGERQASEQLPNVYTDDADLMDGKWCKVPVELFDEVLAQLETEVEVVVWEVSYGWEEGGALVG